MTGQSYYFHVFQLECLVIEIFQSLYLPKNPSQTVKGILEFQDCFSFCTD